MAKLIDLPTVTVHFDQTFTGEEREYQASIHESLILAMGRACWEDLFRNVFTESEMLAWEKTIPHYGCDCLSFYRSWKAKHPPTFLVSLEWKWMLKSAVNEKLGKANLSFGVVFSRYRNTDVVLNTHSRSS